MKRNLSIDPKNLVAVFVLALFLVFGFYLFVRSMPYQDFSEERYIYARYFDQQPVYEFLHDLKHDPDELKNLTHSSEHAEVLSRLRARCDELVEKYGGPLAPLKDRGRRRPRPTPK